MGDFTAFLDASVLYPTPLRDLLLELAVARNIEFLCSRNRLNGFGEGGRRLSSRADYALR